MATLVRDERLLFTGTQLLEAILFHLKDERWFNPIPLEAMKWLKEQLPDSKRVNFKIADWKESQTGTRRMLWILRSAEVDPFELCKYTNGDVEAQVMHRRFTDIMDTWGEH